MSELGSGAILGDGRYEVLRVIGDGSMGEVFEALDVRLKRRVALKILHARYRTHRRISGRIEKEARALAIIDHPHVVRLHDVFDFSERPALVLELLEGGTLEGRLDERGALPWTEAQPLALALLSGLQAIHDAGFVHRDLKPANVLFDKAGHAKIADLGIAHDEQGTRLTRDGATIGTAEYMSPEQIQGTDPSAAADIYSAGILIFELLAGRPPFLDDSEFVVMKGHVEDPPDLDLLPETVPASVRDAIGKALVKLPAGRFASAAELAEALSPALSPTGHAAGRDLQTDIDGGDIHQPARRRIWPLVAILVLALGGAGGWLGYQLMEEEARSTRLAQRLSQERTDHGETEMQLRGVKRQAEATAADLRAKEARVRSVESDLGQVSTAKAELDTKLAAEKRARATAETTSDDLQAKLTNCTKERLHGVTPDIVVFSDSTEASARVVSAFLGIGLSGARTSTSATRNTTFKIKYGGAIHRSVVLAIAGWVEAKTGRRPEVPTKPSWSSKTDDDVFVHLPFTATGTRWP